MYCCVQVVRTCTLPYIRDRRGEFGYIPSLLMPKAKVNQEVRRTCEVREGEHCPSVELVRLVQREEGRRGIHTGAGGSVTLTARDGERTRKSSDRGGPGVHRVGIAVACDWHAR